MVKISKQEFGDWLRNARSEKGVTLRKFAEMVGKSPTYISKIERGDFDPPSEETIRIIARELGQDENLVLGMAGKVSEEIKDIITENPIQAAQFLRTSQGLTKEEWNKLITTAEKLKQKDK